ncbi:MAG: hypothetical protein BWX97_00423 [Firmicutes bacterium ADurb.Bin146]|nr:MAG: hypothetical protein BWX97_00423 [Firmicutes bacterium ADurb.Bin146]
MKKTLCYLLAISLLTILIYPVSATQLTTSKEEVIYGILDEYGQVKKIHVVNSFNQGDISDYGTYIELKNLSSDDKINVQNDTITIRSNQDKIYYQGTLETITLPWTIQIQYLLNGEILKAEDIAGKSGEAEIHISVKPDPDSDPFFYANYTLSINVKLNEKNFTDIQTQNAVIANAGTYKQLSYTLLPNKQMDISIKAYTQNFEMESIIFSGVRMIMDMPIDTVSLTARFRELSDAITKLDNGAYELTEAFDKYVSGLTQYADAQKSFNNGTKQIAQNITNIAKGSSQLSYGLEIANQQGDTLKQAIDSIVQKAFLNANTQIEQLSLGLPVLTEQNYTAILDNIPQLSALKAELDHVIQLKTGFCMYTGSISQLSQAADKLDGGIQQLNMSAEEIKQYSDTLSSSIQTIQDSAMGLKQGLISYKDGISTLNNETRELDKSISKEIDNMIKDIFGNTDIVKSFVSEKNTSVESVQFVIKSEAVKAEKESTAPITEQPKLTFWQKVLKLFGFYR